MCTHDNTKKWVWMGRTEIVCTDCFDMMWHEDKPMTWTDMDTGKVVAVFDDD
jgi:hypothetical protein